MISYIKAEMLRFTRKKSFLLLLVLFTLGYGTIIFIQRKSPGDFIMFNQMLIDLSPMLIGIAIFVMVYTDDISAHSIQIPIGYGISRWKIVLAKMIEVIVVYAGVMAYALLLAFIADALYGANQDFTILFKSLGITLFSTMVYVAMASFFALVVQKGSTAIIVFILLISSMLESLLQLVLGIRFIRNIIPSAANYLPYRLIQDIMFDGWLIQPVSILVLYIVIATALTIGFFNKAELDF